VHDTSIVAHSSFFFSTFVAFSKFLTKVSPMRMGKTREHSAYTLTGLASYLIFPQETASSGVAPASEPSNG
jgi:hypothetical protein